MEDTGTVLWRVRTTLHDRPGALARLAGVCGEAGVNIEVLYSDHEHQVILVVDAMLGNVFSHTPDGVAFRVSVSPDGLLVDDAGPGIADPASAVQRGVSGAGSTGLGLDIVRRAAETLHGELIIGRSPLGGARVGFFLPVRVS